MNSNYEITPEIQAIINEVLNINASNLIKVNALAGTGKTSLIQVLAENLTGTRQKKVLYLAWSKRLVEEAEQTFIRNPNLNIMSVFDLAENYVENYSYMNREYNHNEIADKCEIDIAIAKEVESFLNLVLKNKNPNILADIEPYAEELNKYSNEKFIDSNICNHVHTFLSDIKDGQLKATPNFIVKIFLKMTIYSKNSLDEYDYIFVDEGQDLSDAANVIFENYPATKKVIIGDINQKIYEYENQGSLLTTINAKQFPLTKSYRHQSNIVEKANFILKMFKGIEKEISFMDKKANEVKNEAFISQYDIGAINSINYLNEKGISEFYIKNNPFNIFLPIGVLLKIPIIIENKKAEKHIEYINKIREQWKTNQQYEPNLGFLKYLTREALKVSNFGLVKEIEYAIKYSDKIENLYDLANMNYQSMKVYEEYKYKVGSIFDFKGFEFDKVTIMDDFQDIAYRIATFFVDVVKHKKVKPTFKYIEYFSKYISEKENNEKRYGHYKWIHGINLYYTAITRAKYEFDDLSVNSKYINKDIINKEIGRKISLVIRNQY